jgi:micrococcal nuclease
VRLEYDVQRTDRFGRRLAYVYVVDDRIDGSGDETMVNAALVEAGMAQPMTIPPNVKHAERFRVLAEQARAASRGLWGIERCDQGARDTPTECAATERH